MKVGIIGLGLMGASFAKTLKKLGGYEVYGYDLDQTTMLKADMLGLLRGELNEQSAKDIDMLITSPTTGVTKAFEVKWDTKIHKTANLFLEIVSKYSAGMHGWYEFCEADFLVYGDAVNKIFYVFDMEILRAEVDKMPKELANCGSDSIGYLVPLRRLKELYGVIKI
jgi:hypothetical protein